MENSCRAVTEVLQAAYRCCSSSRCSRDMQVDYQRQRRAALVAESSVACSGDLETCLDCPLASLVAAAGEIAALACRVDEAVRHHRERDEAAERLQCVDLTRAPSTWRSSGRVSSAARLCVRFHDADRHFPL